MTDIIHGRPRPLPVDNPFFRWWQSVDQWTLLATLGLIVVGLILSMAASVPLADSNDMPTFYYVYRQAIYAVISFSLIIFFSATSLSVIRRFGIVGFFKKFMLYLPKVKNIMSEVKKAPPALKVIYRKRLKTSPPSDNKLKKYNIAKTLNC